jgi:hypothetical protein
VKETVPLHSGSANQYLSHCRDGVRRPVSEEGDYSQRDRFSLGPLALVQKQLGCEHLACLAFVVPPSGGICASGPAKAGTTNAAEYPLTLVVQARPPALRSRDGRTTKHGVVAGQVLIDLPALSQPRGSLCLLRRCVTV